LQLTSFFLTTRTVAATTACTCPVLKIPALFLFSHLSCQLRRNLRAIADVILVRVCSASCSWSARACRLITHSSSTSAFLLYLRRRCNGSCPSRNVKTRRMRRRCNGSHPSRPVAEDFENRSTSQFLSPLEAICIRCGGGGYFEKSCWRRTKLKTENESRWPLLD
jgi:hypothetical protein